MVPREGPMGPKKAALARRNRALALRERGVLWRETAQDLRLAPPHGPQTAIDPHKTRLERHRRRSGQRRRVRKQMQPPRPPNLKKPELLIWAKIAGEQIHPCLHSRLRPRCPRLSGHRSPGGHQGMVGVTSSMWQRSRPDGSAIVTAKHRGPKTYFDGDEDLLLLLVYPGG
jgi:hypothetical protein